MKAYFAIYDADGTVSGELSYVLGKLRGTHECALCDISHGWNPLGKSAWRDGCRRLGNLVWLHRNEQEADLAEFTRGKLPCVVAVSEGALEVVLDREALAATGGDFADFEAAFNRAVNTVDSAQ